MIAVWEVESSIKIPSEMIFAPKAGDGSARHETKRRLAEKRKPLANIIMIELETHI